MDSQRIEQRLAFLAFADADRQNLAALAPVLEENADDLVAAFYRHLLSFEPTRGLLADAGVRERLLSKQREYLLSLAGPNVDEAYVAERLRVGETHERVGLEPRWYLGAYSLYFSLLTPLVCGAYPGEPQRAEQTLISLVKLLTLDIELAMDAYIGRREEQLEELNRELAKASKQLAQQVDEQAGELRRTRRRARVAEELASVATLAAGLAHEIGTPMGVIRGHAEQLEQGSADDRSRWRARTITEQIDRISTIIRALLDLARPHEPVLAKVELEPVLDATLAFVGEKLRARGIEVERRFGSAPSVQADVDKLQQVLLNLYLNAVDAMPEGGRLTVVLCASDEGNAEVRVADTGSGIAVDKQPRVFDAFYTTKEVGTGSGLGLAVARRIVAEHGGTLDVESRPGEGAEFRIRLPASA